MDVFLVTSATKNLLDRVADDLAINIIEILLVTGLFIYGLYLYNKHYKKSLDKQKARRHATSVNIWQKHLQQKGASLTPSQVTMLKHMAEFADRDEAHHYLIFDDRNFFFRGQKKYIIEYPGDIIDAIQLQVILGYKGRQVLLTTADLKAGSELHVSALQRGETTDFYATLESVVADGIWFNSEVVTSHFSESTNLTVSIQTGQGEFRFQSRILQTEGNRFLVRHATLIHRRQHRSSARHNVHLGAYLEETKCTIVDLSGGGAQLRFFPGKMFTGDYESLNNKLYFEVPLAAMARSHADTRVKAKIGATRKETSRKINCHVRLIPTDEASLVRVQFLDLRVSDQDAIHRYLMHHETSNILRTQDEA